MLSFAPAIIEPLHLSRCYMGGGGKLRIEYHSHCVFQSDEERNQKNGNMSSYKAKHGKQYYHFKIILPDDVIAMIMEKRDLEV